jgi:hypothetical protein
VPRRRWRLLRNRQLTPQPKHDAGRKQPAHFLNPLRGHSKPLAAHPMRSITANLL